MKAQAAVCGLRIEIFYCTFTPFKQAGEFNILNDVDTIYGRVVMEYSIVRVNRNNYKMFDAMVFFRINKRERTKQEQAEIQSLEIVYEVLDSKNLYVFAAQSENKFVGWISLAYIPKIGRTNGNGHLFIDELWVSPGFRKRGIANALMTQADALSKEINTLGLRLYVNTTNKAAISLYEKFGYANKFGTALFMEKERVD